MILPWFAVQVRSRGEALVESQLQGRAYETFLPTYLECRNYSDRIRKVDVALFPGYLFCRFDPQRRAPILATPGVQRIVSFSGQLTPVDEAELDSVRKVVGGSGSARPWPYLNIGDRVRVEVGAFSGVEGILLTDKGADRLVISVTLLQRSVAVEIDRAWIRSLAPSVYTREAEGRRIPVSGTQDLFRRSTVRISG